ncbi:hypothetical protein GCM10022419_114480 [Nonomuraea rosea]|uniref:Uncharacterized protein n=1 Tax=Nonomuraea rosea TaxID=638574 RepID=A0ABP6ZNU4_9ACTN
MAIAYGRPLAMEASVPDKESSRPPLIVQCRAAQVRVAVHWQERAAGLITGRRI